MQHNICIDLPEIILDALTEDSETTVFVSKLGDLTVQDTDIILTNMCST